MLKDVGRKRYFWLMCMFGPGAGGPAVQDFIGEPRYSGRFQEKSHCRGFQRIPKERCTLLRAPGETTEACNVASRARVRNPYGVLVFVTRCALALPWAEGSEDGSCSSHAREWHSSAPALQEEGSTGGCPPGAWGSDGDRLRERVLCRSPGIVGYWRQASPRAFVA